MVPPAVAEEEAEAEVEAEAARATIRLVPEVPRKRAARKPEGVVAAASHSPWTNPFQQALFE